MVRAIIVSFLVFMILVTVEVMAKKSILKGEVARKAIHISAGIIAALLPFWMPYNYIILLACCALVASLVNNRLNIFKAGKGINRRTYGDFIFGVATLCLAIIRPNKWLFMGAILQVALADGLAGLIGSKYGKHAYKIFGNKKSLEGSLTFFVVSLVTAAIVISMAGLVLHYSAVMVLVLAALLTLLESTGVYGIDNLTLPIAFALLVNWLT